MRAVALMMLFLVFVGFVGLVAAKDPTTGISTGGMPAPFRADPDSLDAAAQIRRIEADALENQAAQERAWNATVMAIHVQSTAEAAAARTAESIRQTQALQVTATAQIVQVTIAAARAQSTQQAVATGTAQGNAQIAAQVTQTADAVRLEVLQAEATRRAQVERLKLNAAAGTAWFWANWLTYLFWAVALILFGLIAGAGYAGVKWLAIQQATAATFIPMDNYGNSYAAVVGGKIINPNQQTAPVLDPAQAAPSIEGREAFRIAELRQAVSAIGALGRGGYRRDGFAAAQQLTQTVNGQPIQTQEQGYPTDPAPWDLTGWTGSTLPLGVGFDNSGIAWHPAKDPNLLIAGTSGGGKSQMITRPLVAEALAASMQVVVMAEKMVDFAIFQRHPNLYRVRGKAADLLALLENVEREVDRRATRMEEIGTATAYDYIPDAQALIGPRIMVMVDGLVKILFAEPDKSMRSAIWSRAISVASLCRATGVMLVLATTDPSGRLGDNFIGLRENCGRIALRVNEAAASQVILEMPGAEKLEGSQVIARLEGKPIRGVAFWPKDSEIAAFLAARPVPTLPAPAFLPQDGEHAPLKPEPEEVKTREDRIRELHAQGKTPTEIQREIFGPDKVGGNYYYAVKTVIDQVTGSNGNNNNSYNTESDPLAAD